MCYGCYFIIMFVIVIVILFSTSGIMNTFAILNVREETLRNAVGAQGEPGDTQGGPGPLCPAGSDSCCDYCSEYVYE